MNQKPDAAPKLNPVFNRKIGEYIRSKITSDDKTRIKDAIDKISNGTAFEDHRNIRELSDKLYLYMAGGFIFTLLLDKKNNTVRVLDIGRSPE